ncbi:hypothetical protein INS49_002808 [Diaporthe citri]|uniref:uncharacterized protein n=1 Tax=Diaporthe citri TaxID=83186 RepID=UPI001C8029DF|nr:uncharacterized protein INS49_002808 [Diaporthe citri]KAG6368595.1 hypothetical protein INS49_002808 [Diaporthe citri]
MCSPASDQLKKRTFYPDRWPRKTVDIGANGVTVSANPLGQIYQISAPLTAANKFGIMVAAPWPQFDHAQRLDPEYVREFRKIPEKLLMQQINGLGLDFGGPKGPVVTRPSRDSIGSQVQFEYLIRGDTLFVQTALKVHDDGTVTHASKVTNMGNTAQNIPVTLDLAFAVSRAGYGQLTDRGAVDMPDPSNSLDSFRGPNGDGVLAVENRSLGGRVLAHIIFYNETTNDYIEVKRSLYAQRGMLQSPPHRPSQGATQEIRLGPGETLKLAVAFRPENISSADPPAFSPGVIPLDEIAPGFLFSHQDGMSDSREVAKRHIHELCGFNWDSAETIESTILWANVNYILGCCCVPMSGSEGDGTCCIADHFALNLGWPRDNYWQMRLLRKLNLCNLANLLPDNWGIARQYDVKIYQALTSHLTWLFEMAVTQIEIDGTTRHFWRRSYLVNGQPKDGEVFQLDTQCYPFLELCEYFEAYGHEPETKAVIESILQTDSFKNILHDLLSRQDVETNLFASDETPADDELGDYKFHLSSNILLWHTLCKLGELLSCPQFRPLASATVDIRALKRLAVTIRKSILINFRSRRAYYTVYDGQRTVWDILAYGFDPSKEPGDPRRHRYYHDGNDMPTLYAPEWGFLKSNDYDEDESNLRTLWENTMIWAFNAGPAEAGFNSGYKGNGTEPFHGLGSDHSPGPWTLGFFQEWKFAQMVGDERREHKAWSQIVGSAQFDGTFSEAVDIYTGVCTSKTWFSWPGAMIAENLIDAVIKQVQHGEP